MLLWIQSAVEGISVCTPATVMLDIDLRYFAASLFRTPRQSLSLDRNTSPMMSQERYSAIAESACYLPQAQERPCLFCTVGERFHRYYLLEEDIGQL